MTIQIALHQKDDSLSAVRQSDQHAYPPKINGFGTIPSQIRLKRLGNLDVRQWNGAPLS